MPTKALAPPRPPPPRPSLLPGLQVPVFHESRSWTDDLPVCRASGVGFSTNQLYREDGVRVEEHSFEDQSFHFFLDEDTLLYGIFDGQDGVSAAQFAAQRIPAEILLGQLIGKTNDKDIKEVLRQAFITVERGFFDSIDDKLAERTNLQCEIPAGLNSYEAYQKYPNLVNKLRALNAEVAACTTAVVVLVCKNKLYVANVGDSRALLCKTDPEGVLRVIQITIDHNLRNEDELLRLSQSGLDIEKFRQGERLGDMVNTRCIGNYMVKGGYSEFEDMKDAHTEPVIAEPEIHGGMPLDESCRFLLLMSDGLYKSLEEAAGTEQVNKDIAQLVVEQFRVQSTLTGVAQAVVDKVVRIHHDTYMSGASTACQKRDDITLLVRNFNFPLPNALSPTTVRFNPIVTQHSNNNTAESEDTHTNTANNNGTATQTNTSTNTTSSDLIQSENNQLPLDEDGRIEPYVDFSEYYEAIEKAQKEGNLPKDDIF